MDTQPRSLSVYRGQSRTGVGEGPEKTVLHGEQYLQVAPELYRTELLDAIRPWMTLDSDPADHQRLNDQLEGWSLFPAADYLFVVRLVSAGTYDRRAAYFAHARAWNTKSLSPAFDPGLYLGRTDAFDEPWRDAARAGPAPADGVALWPEQVKAESETAARFLGHLFQALLDNSNNPLIVAAPIAAFLSRGALNGLVCFARAALPAKLRQACRIRVYSRMPELFLRHLGANFVVVPEDAASAALMARPAATLLDRQGQKIAGKDLDVRTLDYARAVVERTIAIPEGLSYFSDRFQRHVWQGGLPSAADTRTIQVTYNVAFALGGPLERRADLIRQYLPRAATKLGPGLDWNRLLSDAWPLFPPDALLDQLLADSRNLSESGLEFLRALEEGAAGLGLRVDSRLGEWWDAEDPAKLHRLVELLAHAPPLVSAAVAAELTATIGLRRLAQSGPLHAALQAEAGTGSLRKRAHESGELAVQANDRKVFEVISRAVSDGRLDPGWAESYVQSAKPETLVEAARLWFADPQFWIAWSGVPKLLLDRLRTLDSGFDDLAPLLLEAGFRVDPVKNLEVYLGLANLLEKIKARGEENPLMRRFWEALPRLTESRADLERFAFDPQWRCLQLANLEIENLLDLADGFRKDESFRELYKELDARMLRDAEATTQALVEKGWWYFWRSQSGLTSKNPEEAAALRKSAFRWLASDRWADPRAEATLEAWKKALEDVPLHISGETFAGLRDNGGRGRRPWPWIPPFEKEQLLELVGRAEDLGAVAEIAEIVDADERAPSVSRDYFLETSLFSNDLPMSAFAWLAGENPGEALSIKDSAFLYEHAGNRKDRALKGRIHSVAYVLEQNPREALVAAGAPDLWSDSRFLYKIADWMNRKGSYDSIGRDAVHWIETHVRGELKTPVRSLSRELVQELVDQHCNRAARLLHPAWQEDSQKEHVADKVIQALLSGDSTHECWQQLAKAIKHAKSVDAAIPSRHPLIVIADRILDPRRLSRDERNTLALNGWSTFEAAAGENRELMLSSSHPTIGLSLFNLAASMLRPGATGQAVLQIIFAAANRGLREDVQWWRSLVRAIRDFKRYGDVRSADDREEMAMAVILGYLDSPREHDVVSEAMEAEAINSPEWTLLSEFGMGTL